MTSSKPTIVSLFDYSGNWVKPYREAGYNVIQVDIKHGDDVMTWEPPNLPIQGVLAALPCTDFAGLGARHWADKDADGRTASSVALAYRTLLLIDQMAPTWWALENPVGRLNRLIPELKPFGPWYFNPCDFGDPYTKKTGLWGSFNRNLKKTPIRPIKEINGQSWIHCKLGGASDKTKELRSTTPMGFAYAFFNANP